VYVTDPIEQRRLEESKKQKDELSSRKSVLLNGLTEQMKVIMGRIADPGVPEAKKASLRVLLLQIKDKITTLNNDSLSVDGQPAVGQAGKGKGVGRSDSYVLGGQWTLDLRTKILRVKLKEGWNRAKLREELHKVGVSEQQLVDVQGDPLAPQAAESEVAFIRFKDRWSAEQLFNKRDTFPCSLDWCDNPPPVHAPSMHRVAQSVSGVAPNIQAPLTLAAEPMNETATARDSSAQESCTAEAAAMAEPASGPPPMAERAAADNGGDGDTGIAGEHPEEEAAVDYAVDLSEEEPEDEEDAAVPQ
jgi:hypothetical protein